MVLQTVLDLQHQHVWRKEADSEQVGALKYFQ